MRTLQHELEAALALVGHAALIIALQYPLLLGCEYRPQVHLKDRRTSCKELNNVLLQQAKPCYPLLSALSELVADALDDACYTDVSNFVPSYHSIVLNATVLLKQ